MVVCIFMASSTNNLSPFTTLAPTLTESVVTRPGMGAPISAGLCGSAYIDFLAEGRRTGFDRPLRGARGGDLELRAGTAAASAKDSVEFSTAALTPASVRPAT